MNKLLVDAKAVEVFSRIAGEQFSQQEVSPLAVFLAAAIAVLQGALVMDRVVAIAEEKHLQKTLNYFLPANPSLEPLIQQLLAGVEKQQIYLKPNELIALAAGLSPSQKLLLLGFGYQMSAADTHLDDREQMYLQSIALRLDIPLRQAAVFKAAIAKQGSADPEAIAEVRDLLHPAQFESLDPGFAQAAKDILAALPLQH